MARLNTNILYLCYTQRVKLNKLSPGHTLENIEKLLNPHFSDLGRIGAVDVNDGFVGTADFQLIQDLLTGADSESEEGNTCLTPLLAFYPNINSLDKFTETDIIIYIYVFLCF